MNIIITPNDQNNRMIPSYIDEEGTSTTSVDKYIMENYYFYFQKKLNISICQAKFQLLNKDESNSDYNNKISLNKLILNIITDKNNINNNNIYTVITYLNDDTSRPDFLFFSFYKYNKYNLLNVSNYIYPNLHSGSFSLTENNTPISFTINKIQLYETMNVYVNTNIISYSEISTNFYVYIKSTLDINRMIIFKFVNFYNSEIFLGGIYSYENINNYNNISAYKFIITGSEKYSEYYLIYPIIKKSNEFKLVIHIIHEKIKFQQFYYKSSLNYINSFFITNTLYPLRFAYNDDGSLDMINLKGMTTNLENENLIEMNFRATNIAGINFNLSIANTISFPKFGITNFPYFNLTVPTQEHSCAADKFRLIYFKTNLRILDWTEIDKLSKLSLFENEFSIFPNPDCKCMYYSISTTGEMVTKENSSGVLTLKLTKLHSGKLTYILSRCSGYSDFTLSFDFESVSFKPIFKGKMNVANKTDFYYLITSSTLNIIKLVINYDFTSKTLLRNIFNQNEVCKFEIEKDDLSYTDNISYQDCFNLFIKTKDTKM